MKSYTDLKQSRKLAEILPIESADMYYKYVLPKSDKIKHIPEIGNPVDSLKWYNEGYTFRDKREPITLSEYCIPCWSLAALLELIPNYVINKVDDKIYANLYYGLKSSHDNLVDAAFEMICQLKENNKI